MLGFQSCGPELIVSSQRRHSDSRDRESPAARKRIRQPTVRTSMSKQQVLSNLEIGEILGSAPKAEPAIERRKSKRFAYSVVQSLATYDGANLPKKSDFRQVNCRDLSATGISFLFPSRLESEHVLFALGKPPQLFYVTAQVISCRPAPRGFIVGCSFLTKVNLTS